MSDDWEDWENDHFTISEEQLKRLKEIRLVEESDNGLTRNLFSNEEDLAVKEFEQKKLIKSLIKSLPKTGKEKKNNTSSKQKENEEKQKELSKKNKEEKNIKKRENEIFGEADEDNEYAKYEDMFY
jgi:hypothetical protein